MSPWEPRYFISPWLSRCYLCFALMVKILPLSRPEGLDISVSPWGSISLCLNLRFNINLRRPGGQDISVSPWLSRYYLCFALMVKILPLSRPDDRETTSVSPWWSRYYLCFALMVKILPLSRPDDRETTSVSPWWSRYLSWRQFRCQWRQPLQSRDTSVSPQGISVSARRQEAVLHSFKTIFFFSFHFR